MYLARVLVSRSNALRVLLSCSLLPWGKLIRKDFDHIYKYHASVISSLCNIENVPSCDEVDVWRHIVKHKRWPEIVAHVFFVESILDPAPSKEGEELGYVCVICTPHVMFSSSQALDSHKRTKHDMRNFMRTYIDDSCICPSCETSFSCRLSMLSHVSDKRRTKCREYIIENCSPILEMLLHELDERDNILRRNARRAGHSHHIVTAHASNTGGRVVGRFSM